MPPIERTLAYTDGDTPLTGALYRDESQQKELPGILLIHGGAGLDDHARDQAQRWAALGYVVLACDMYGDGVAGDRDRIMAALTALRDDPDGSGGERWWDGKGWTRHRRPRSGSPATTDTGRQRAARPQAAPPTSADARRNAPAAGPADTQGGQSASRPPGWYRDPSSAGGRRFWDGTRWTNGT